MFLLFLYRYVVMPFSQWLVPVDATLYFKTLVLHHFSSVHFWNQNMILTHRWIPLSPFKHAGFSIIVSFVKKYHYHIDTLFIVFDFVLLYMKLHKATHSASSSSQSSENIIAFNSQWESKRCSDQVPSCISWKGQSFSLSETQSSSWLQNTIMTKISCIYDTSRLNK